MTVPPMTDEAKALVAKLREVAKVLFYEMRRPTDSETVGQAFRLIETQAREIERLNAILSEMNDTDVIAQTMAENERLNEALCFIGKWVERGMFCSSVTASEAISCIAHYPDMPWNSQRWDVDHKPYAAPYYAKFPRTAALAGDSHDQ